jgi:hypothetical protein
VTCENGSIRSILAKHVTNLDGIFPRKHSYNGEVEYFFVIYSFSERTTFHYFSLSPKNSIIRHIWHLDQTVPSRHHHPYPLPLSVSLLIIRSSLVWGRLAGGFGWLESPTDSLSFISATLPFQLVSRPSTAMDVW